MNCSSPKLLKNPDNLHYNHQFFEVFQITQTNSSLILILLKNPEHVDLWFWNAQKTRCAVIKKIKYPPNPGIEAPMFMSTSM
jgi:hypothetical protein